MLKKTQMQFFRPSHDTLEVSTSYWNHIDEMYSDIKQGDDESIDKLDQQYKESSREVSVHRGRKTGT